MRSAIASREYSVRVCVTVRHVRSSFEIKHPMFNAYDSRWTTPNRFPHASVSGDDLPLAYEDTLVKFRPTGALCTRREREERLVLRCHGTVLRIEVSHNSPPSHLRLTGYRSMRPHLLCPGVCGCGDEQRWNLARFNSVKISRFCSTRHLNVRAVIQLSLINWMSSNARV